MADSIADTVRAAEQRLRGYAELAEAKGRGVYFSAPEVEALAALLGHVGDEMTDVDARLHRDRSLGVVDRQGEFRASWTAAWTAARMLIADPGVVS